MTQNRRKYDNWGDFTTGITQTAKDFLPNIVILGWGGHGSYSYQKVKKALARQGKENLFQESKGNYDGFCKKNKIKT